MDSVLTVLSEECEQSHPALFDARRRRWWNRAQLQELVADIAGCLDCAQKSLAFCLCCNDVGSVAGYLAAIAAGHTVALFSATTSGKNISKLLSLYEPTFLLCSEDGNKYMGSVSEHGYQSVRGGAGHTNIWCRKNTMTQDIHADLAVLLSTSGSTGSTKLVRLSAANLVSNAQAIAGTLGISKTERAITSVPIEYAYGLSVLNSHLVSGASTVLTDANILSSEFWDLCRSEGCTSFAGVPYTYSLLSTVDWEKLRVPR